MVTESAAGLSCRPLVHSSLITQNESLTSVMGKSRTATELLAIQSSLGLGGRKTRPLGHRPDGLQATPRSVSHSGTARVAIPSPSTLLNLELSLNKIILIFGT